MAVSVKTLRWVIVSAAMVVVLVLVGLVGYGRWKARSFLSGLPKRLGMSLQQETDNVTYSQSYRGRTVFTVHAAKQIQHADGKYTLKDVAIVLYGKEGDREDRIRGQQFEYDQKNGVLRAEGEVYLDLAGPGGSGTAKVVHVKTSGLVYIQKERTAATDALTEFIVEGFSGRSVGATYAGDSGTVVLRSEVRLNGIRDGRPVLLTAARAELDRGEMGRANSARGQANIIKLEGAQFTQQGEHGAETAAADHAVVLGREDGTPERVQGEGHVVLTATGRGVVTSERMDMDLNGKGGPKMVHLAGAVKYKDDARGKQERGSAEDARLLFNAAGRPLHATLVGGAARAVELDESAAGAERRLLGDRVEVDFGERGNSKAVLRGAVATAGEGARLHLADVDERGARVVTDVRASRLSGRFAADGSVTGLDGAGRTFVERDAPGLVETSTGDMLRLDFKPGARGKMELARATQSGAVETMRQSAAKKAGGPNSVERGRAATVAYDAGTDVATMTGGVQVSDATSLLLAEKVTANRATGEGTAEGGVRVSYLEAAESSAAKAQSLRPREPVHVVAARAVSHKNTGVTEFFAAPGGRARLWQAGSAVEAPVLDLDRTKKVVVAKDGARAVLVGETGDPASPVRVSGPIMTYNDAARTVVVTGPMRVDNQDGTMTAKDGTVYLLPAAAGSAGSLMGGKVERVVGSGNVVVTQPGRKATGERLVYTAADDTFVMTGAPRLTDAVNGTVTGNTIRFKRGDESVVVTGGDGRVRTETRVKQ